MCVFSYLFYLLAQSILIFVLFHNEEKKFINFKLNWLENLIAQILWYFFLVKEKLAKHTSVVYILFCTQTNFNRLFPVRLEHSNELDLFISLSQINACAHMYAYIFNFYSLWLVYPQNTKIYITSTHQKFHCWCVLPRDIINFGILRPKQKLKSNISRQFSFLSCFTL